MSFSLCLGNNWEGTQFSKAVVLRFLNILAELDANWRHYDTH
jgi:hypothetical protein